MPILYFDLETVPDEDRELELIELGVIEPQEVVQRTDGDDLPEPANFIDAKVSEIEEDLAAFAPVDSYLIELENAEKSREKPRKGVLDAINKSRQVGEKNEKAKADFSKNSATSPELCKLAAIGYAVGDSKPVAWVDGRNGGTESDALQTLWEQIAKADSIVGFNVLEFDLPVVMARSILLDVPAARDLTKAKPWENLVVDLYKKRFPRGNRDARKPGTLKKLASCYGIEVPSGDFHGGEVAGAMQTEEGREKVAQYVRSDVEITRSLHRKFSGYFC